MAIDYEITVKKTGNPLVQVSCQSCGEKFVLRGSVEKDGTITTGVKMCFCGNNDLKHTVLQ